MDIKTLQKMNESESGGNQSDNYAVKVITLALDIAEQMLVCGAEIHRVEDTFERICRAYGASYVDVFTITTLIISEIVMKNGTSATRIRRVYSSSNNLYRLEVLNGISREICSKHIGVDEASRKVKETKNAKAYNRLWRYLGAVIGASAFCVFFGGSLLDAIPTGIIAFVMTLFDFHKSNRFSQIMHTSISSFLAGSLSILSVYIGLGQNLDMIMIGTIMLLIPGLALGNSLRDMLCGDIVSGIMKLVQSVLLAGTIALGYFVSILLLGGLLK